MLSIMYDTDTDLCVELQRHLGVLNAEHCLLQQGRKCSRCEQIQRQDESFFLLPNCLKSSIHPASELRFVLSMTQYQSTWKK